MLLYSVIMENVEDSLAANVSSCNTCSDWSDCDLIDLSIIWPCDSYDVIVCKCAESVCHLGSGMTDHQRFLPQYLNLPPVNCLNCCNSPHPVSLIDLKPLTEKLKVVFSNFLSQHSTFQEVELGMKQVECDTLNQTIEDGDKKHGLLVSFYNIIIIYVYY